MQPYLATYGNLFDYHNPLSITLESILCCITNTGGKVLSVLSVDR